MTMIWGILRSRGNRFVGDEKYDLVCETRALINRPDTSGQSLQPQGVASSKIPNRLIRLRLFEMHVSRLR